MPAAPNPAHAPDRRRWHRWRTLVVSLLALSLVAGTVPHRWAQGESHRPDPAMGVVSYEPPVDGTVVDTFRPPEHPYGPGNRGLKYRTEPGAPVHAAADGTVMFAGPVGGSLHVTVGHADGLRTSSSFLAEVHVVVGQRVHQGDLVGTSVGLVHFGVRDPAGNYLDPEDLLGGHGPRVRLVAHRPPTATGVRLEGLALLGAVFDSLTDGRASTAVHYARELRVDVRLTRMAQDLVDRRRAQQACTPPVLVPPAPSERRVVVLVAGIGSSSDEASVDDVDVDGLGYAADDVVRFSYQGGRTPHRPDAGPLAAVPASRYGAEHTQADLVSSAGHLRVLLADVAARSPGVPIDLIAHSQGGVVARLAVGDLAGGPPLPEEVDLVATLASPHRGTDLATAVRAVVDEPRGAHALEFLDRWLDVGLDPQAPSVRQLAETSGLQRVLAASEPPDGVRLLAVGARGDLVVPSVHTGFWDAPHPVVPLVGPTAHAEIAGHPVTTRELALALAGWSPTCVPVSHSVLDVVSGEATSWAQDWLGASAWAQAMVR